MGGIMSTINANGTMAFGNALGGSATIVPKNDTAINYTVTIPDVTAQVAVGRANDEAVMTALNATGSAPIYACRAWVNFNGTGTVAIRASGNVSSITDNGVGDYTVNFTTAMPDANYAYQGGGQRDTTNPSYLVIVIGRGQASAQSTTSLRIITTEQTTTPIDMQFVTLSIFR